MGLGQSSSTSIHEVDEKGSLSITSNIRKLTEGKIDISETGKDSSTPQANCQSQDMKDFTDALHGEDMNQSFMEVIGTTRRLRRGEDMIMS